ncbi:MAG: peptidyl-prolyl cis-trans isomerase [Elusimicrobiota bacterium]
MKGMLFVLVGTLLGAGAVSAEAKAKDPVIVKVDGAEIRKSEVYQRLWDIQGTTVLEQMIDRHLIERDAKKRKIVADESDVERRMDAIGQQLPEGTSLEQKLNESGLTLEKLRKEITFEVLRDGLVVEAAEIAVSSTEVRAAYEANRNRLGNPEAVRLRHILVQTEREADDLLIALKAGADFEKLASAKSLNADTRDKGGDLGFITPGMLRPEIEKAVWKLRAGELSPIVDTGQGFHIFQAVERREGKPAEFEEVSADLHRAIRNRKIAAALPGVVKDLRAKAKIERE